MTETFGLTYAVQQDAPGNHIFARPGTHEAYNLVNVTALAAALRFVSTGGRDRLSVQHNRTANTFELRSLRVLTPLTVELLSDVWDTRERLNSPPDPNAALPVTVEEPDDQTFLEGAVKLRTHLAHERNRALVVLAKQRFKVKHGGRLFCQACGFDFHDRYGSLGEDYIEAHHTVPVSELSAGDATRIDDLAMVCANCHRMLHRRRPWLRMEELTKLLA